MEELKEYGSLIKATAVRFGLDPCLVAAMVLVESSGDPWAARFEPNVYASGRYLQDPKDRPRASSRKTEYIHQATSWGLMQVMGFNVRAAGDLKGEWLHRMCEPAIGLGMGCKHLAGLLTRWETWDAVSAYNQGSPRKATDGSYKNQEYVDKVKDFLGQVQVWGFGAENQVEEETKPAPATDQEVASEGASEPGDLLDEVSTTRLATCDERLQGLIRVAAENIPLRVIEGHMNNERLKSLVAAGEARTLLNPQLKSPSPAVVVAPTDSEGKLDIRVEAFERLVSVIMDLASEMGIDLVWGGDMSPVLYSVKWRNDGYFELKG